MRSPHAAKYLALVGFSSLSLFIGCVSEDTSVSETEVAYALRSELSGSPNGKKTYVCHIPPGNPANAHTIHVGNAAVDAHLAHGDSLGQCQPSSEAALSANCHGKGHGKKKKSIQNVIKREGKSWKAIVCHIPPGNPANAHTISVGVAAVRAHLAHGDSLGACPAADSPTPTAMPDCPETGGGEGGGGGSTNGGEGEGGGSGSDSGSESGSGSETETGSGDDPT